VLSRSKIFDECHSRYQPANMKSFLGIPSTTNQLLYDLKPYELPMPWLNIEWRSYKERHRAFIIKEIQSFHSNVRMFPGWAACGTLSIEKVNLNGADWQKFIKVLKDIVKVELIQKSLILAGS
jgi:hypothetical protein